MTGREKRKCKDSGQIRVKEKKTSERESEKIDMKNLEQLSRTLGLPGGTSGTEPAC